jgi:fructose-bisphosphate aldolase, class I
MCDETAQQKFQDGTPFPNFLAYNGILPGIKLDKELAFISGTDGKTLGLDGYYQMGFRFAKWHAILKITDEGCPSDATIEEAAKGLAMFAKICQDNGLVPIVEPEVLTDGKHDIKKCAAVSEKILSTVMDELVA